jgi:putative component of membrane protein insertase Oxa1/YidC/SpoIIIJ protein YidD
MAGVWGSECVKRFVGCSTYVVPAVQALANERFLSLRRILRRCGGVSNGECRTPKQRMVPKKNEAIADACSK